MSKPALTVVGKCEPPKVPLLTSEPLQDWYRDRDGDRYSVARLLDDTKGLPVFEMPVAGIDLSDVIWVDANLQLLAFHVRSCMNADLSYPILLDWNGTIADGRHRVIKALATGKRTIKARRMTWKPTPDRKADD